MGVSEKQSQQMAATECENTIFPSYCVPTKAETKYTPLHVSKQNDTLL